MDKILQLVPSEIYKCIKDITNTEDGITYFKAGNTYKCIDFSILISETGNSYFVWDDEERKCFELVVIQPIEKMPHEIVSEETKRKQSKQSELDNRYMRMAEIWSENSYAIRRKVGCLIIKDNMIISDGYNGTPSGFVNVCEYCVDNKGNHKYFDNAKELEDFAFYNDYKLVTKPEVLHAEANAISKLARSGNSSCGATLYVTDEPCLQCAKLIVQAGIVRVVYWKDYHSHEGIELLREAKIEVEQINI